MQPPKLPSVFKAMSPEQFRYRPRYWNPAKEKLDKRKKIAEMEAKNMHHQEEERLFQPSFRQHSMQNHLPKMSVDIRKSNRRLLVIIFIISMIAYLIVKSPLGI